jgi:ADP-ribose pyrophosphatase YjhB (NUDIX family)
MSAAVRGVAEEAGVAITVSALAGVYSDPRHVLVYPGVPADRDLLSREGARRRPDSPDTEETIEADWVEPGTTPTLPMHPTMRQRLTHALDSHARAHFD